MIALAVVVGVLAAAFVTSMIRRPSNRSIAAFAKTYEVPLTPHNVDQVRSYIQWSRRWRAGVAITAVVANLAISAFTGRSSSTAWLTLVIGYACGSLLGELLRPVERLDGSTPSASLHRRRVRDFVIPRFLVAVTVVFVASLIPSVFLLVTNPQRSWVTAVDPANQAQYRPQDWFVLLLTLASIVAGVVAWVATTMLVRAPIPADTADRMAVRHAIRTAAVLSVIGATVMISGAIGAKLGNAAALLDGDASTLAQWTINLTGFGCAIASMWGAILTLTTIPRLAPFSGPLPTVPDAEPTGLA